MASAIFFLDLKGKTLLARNYRGDIPMSAVEKFPILLSDAEEESSAVPPCFSHEGINYLYIRHSNLYILALTKKNTNATEILLFLHKIVEVFTEYFKVLEEESIRDNFVIIYELLDEMMDFGYPQTTESKILQEYITQESHKLEVQARPPIAVTNAVSWRSEGIRYRKNEVFLDVVESLNLLVSASGNVLRSEILGAIKMKCYLSGMPELRLGLNDKVMFETTGRATRGKAVEMEDVKFHQCVRLSRFENDRTISFIPPDGEFELMSYRLNTQVKPLIWVECLVESHSGSRMEYMLKAKAQFKRRSTANNVEILVPVPEDADSPRFRTNIGTVHYAPEKSAIIWKIKQFGGGKEFLMRAELGLPSVKGDDEHGGGMTGGFGGSMGGTGGGKAKRPINVKFEIPYFTTSGIQVRYLKITEPKLQYPSLPWVRYITQSGDIAVRRPGFVLSFRSQLRVLRTSATSFPSRHKNSARSLIPFNSVNASRLPPPSLTTTTTINTPLHLMATQTRSHGGHGGHHHHHHGGNVYLTSTNKKDAGVRITRIGLVANLAMAIGKFIGGYVFHSQALIADAYHALTDLVSDILTLGTVAWSLKPPSERFPNGYGKIESIGALGVSGLLLCGGVFMGLNSGQVLLDQFYPQAAEAISHLGHGHSHSHGIDIHGPSIHAAWLAAGSIVVKEWLYHATMKVANERKSSVLASNAIHHRIDSLTSIVALFTIGGTYLFKDASWLDPVGGLLISLMVIKAGWGNTCSSLLELADTAVDDEIKESVQKAASKALAKLQDNNAIKIRDVQGMKSGQNYLMDIELAVPGAWPINRSREIEEIVRTAIGAGVRGVKRVKVRFIPLEHEELNFSEEFIPAEVASQANPEPEDGDADCEAHGHDHGHDVHEHDARKRR
ncbi:cation efflux protein [Aspergillus oryzae]|uniref:Cation efflux protein n=1 Tax=Aspergillus oryzae TaxID=5062 RepID=A0A1S9DH39_ASPOZ|nr:cation efflux protein [Aspergillus oryzae]